jgi:hypothetical protein
MLRQISMAAALGLAGAMLVPDGAGKVLASATAVRKFPPC